MELFQLFGSIFIKDSEAKKSLDNIDKKGKDTESKFKKVAKGFGVGAAAIGTALVGAGTAMVGLAVKTGNYSDRILDLNAITGMSTDAIQEWQQVAKVAGVDTETITRASEKLTKTMAVLEKGTGKQTASLNKLGISYKDLEQATPDQRMEMLTKALAGIEDPAERARIGTDLFGGSWKDLAPVVSMGAEGMEDARKQAHELGAVLSNEALNDANNFRIAMENMKTTVSSAGMQIGAKFAPILTDVLMPAIDKVIPIFVKFAKMASDGVMFVIEWIGKLVDTVKAWVKDNSTQIDTVKAKFKSFFDNVMEFVKSFVSFFMKVWDKYGDDLIKHAENVWNLVKVVFKTTFDLINDWLKVFSALFKGDWKGLWDAVKNLVANTWENIKKLLVATFNVIKDVAKTAWSVIKDIFSTLLEAIKGVVKSAFEDIKTAIQNKMDETKAKIQAIWESVETYFKNISLVQIGKDIIQGLINGISSMAKSVTDKVKELANLIPDGMKKFLGIKSPSRLMKDQVGKWIPIGVAEGIEGNLGSVVKAATKMAKATVPKFSGELAITKGELEKFNKVIASVNQKAIKEIAQIQNQAAKERAQTKANDFKKLAKITEDENRKINAIESNLSKERFKALEDYVSKRKGLESMTTEQEVEFWKQATKEFKKESSERIQAQINYKKAKDALDQETFKKEKTYIESRKELNKLSLIEELKMWEDVSKRYKKGTDERLEAEKNARNIRVQIYNELKSASEDYLAKVKEVNERLIQEEKRLNEEYSKAVEQRTQAIASFIGIFDAVSTDSEKSGAELLNNLEGQVGYLETWAKNIEMLANRGIDQGLLAELQDMGPKAGNEIAALLQLTDTELTKYSALWKEKNELAKRQAVAELEGLKIETNKKIKELRKNSNLELETYKTQFLEKITSIRTGTEGEFNALTSSLPEIGKNAIQGLMDGMEAMTGPLMAKAQKIADTVSKTIKKALDINSPSRLLMQYGEWTGEGFAEGLENSNDIVKKASLSLAQTVPNQLSGGSSTSISKSFSPTVTNNFYSNQLTPSEVARKNLQTNRQLAIEWGV